MSYNVSRESESEESTLKTPVQKRVLQILINLADENREVHQSLPEIVMQAQASRNTVIRVLHELADQGDISILNPQRVKGHYRINNELTKDKPSTKPTTPPIVDAIRLLPLPVRVSVIFQALARRGNRSGSIIPSSIPLLMDDTGYSQSIIQETLRWLLRASLIVQDEGGYKISGWDRKAKRLVVSEEQVEQIKTFHHQRQHFYWKSREQDTH